MTLSTDPEGELLRARIVLVVIIAAFLFLIATLWRVQVRNVSAYRSNVEKQSIRRVRLPGTRGMILDRNGVCLADNRPSYCIAIYMEELWQAGPLKNTVKEIERIINSLSGILNLEKVVSRDDIINHLNRRRSLPFLAWSDVDEGVIARWAESGVNLPGVDIYVEPVRMYPQGELAGHVLGYVARAELDKSIEESYDFYLPEVEGAYGLEMALNDLLKGAPGGQLIRVDVIGLKHKDEGTLLPASGLDVVLTLDSRIQRLVEDVLAGQKGACVVIDPRNGDILAMASSPSFDSNSFTPTLSKSEWARLSTAEEKPLFNRAIAGAYPPGSVFKPVVAIASLENKMASENTSFNCAGFFQLGDVRFHCWRTRGHGIIGLKKALEQSCNSYFCQLGLLCGYDRIFNMARALGFGRKTGIELEGESDGLLPDGEWNRRNIGVGWRKGDTCNVSIGQGALAVTPLQMAVLAATIANGGYLYKPRLLARKVNRGTQGLKENSDGHERRRMYGMSDGDLVRSMEWSRETVRIVKEGMYDVVHADSGTGKRAKIPGLKMGGKTGTAQYGLLSEGKKHGWMIIFAPFDEPRYAIALVIEDAVSGGVTVAPRIKTLMEGILEIENAGIN